MRHRAFTLIEILVTLAIIGVITGLTVPRMNLSQSRSDAAAQQVRSVFQTAQRTSLTRQYDVIVSIDTLLTLVRIAEDGNNNGIIEPNEVKFWRPPGEGNRFSVPPVNVDSTRPAPTTSVVGSTLKKVDNLPSLVFHRDGSVSSEAQVYLSSTYKTRTDFRAITLTRSTGRTELYRLSGTGPKARFITAAQ